jgi:hypothetical protein
LNRLCEGDEYSLSPIIQKFLQYARELGLMVTQWSTMNKTHPWKLTGEPFRKDRLKWLREVEGEAQAGTGWVDFKQRLANCLACSPFNKWLKNLIKQIMKTGYYGAWTIDGDF